MTDYETERLRTEVERTRQELSDDVNRLGATVSPSNIAERQKAKVSQRVSGWKNRVMGVAEGAKESTMGAAHGVADTGPSAVDSVQGGAHDMKVKARQQAQPLVEQAKTEVKEAGSEMAEHLKQPVQEAVEEVKTTASDSAQELKSQTQSSAESVRTEAQQQAQDVKR